MRVLGEYQTSVRKAFDEIDPNWESYDGVVICGSHHPDEFDIFLILEEIKEARKSGRPLYGECWGYQLCAIEYAKNVLEIEDATSEEFGKGTFVVKKRKDGLKVGLYDGESYWNNFEVDLSNWEIPKNFFIAQYHASYQSSIDKPHPLIKNFLNLCRNTVAIGQSH